MQNTFTLRFIRSTCISLLLLASFGLGDLTASAESVADTRKSREYLTVYDKQKNVTEAEIRRFLTTLPLFRSWAQANHEEAHPFLTKGKPDFKYSQKAGEWIKKNGWEPRRFFCVMGRMAAALVIIEEGNDLKGTRPPDMPEVSEAELALAHRHLAELLSSGGAAAPNVTVDTPKLPRK